MEAFILASPSKNDAKPGGFDQMTPDQIFIYTSGYVLFLEGYLFLASHY